MLHRDERRGAAVDEQVCSAGPIGFYIDTGLEPSPAAEGVAATQEPYADFSYVDPPENIVFCSSPDGSLVRIGRPYTSPDTLKVSRTCFWASRSASLAATTWTTVKYDRSLGRAARTKTLPF